MSSNESLAELHQTAEGMRRAGADRQAVVDRLVGGGISVDQANGFVDAMDRDNGVQFGDRPDDISPMAATAMQAQLEVSRAKTAIEKPEQRADFVRSFKIEAAQMQASGMTDDEVVAVLIGRDLSTAEADEVLFEIATDPPASDLNAPAQKRLNRRNAYLGLGSGIFGIIVAVVPLLTGSTFDEVSAVFLGGGIVMIGTSLYQFTTGKSPGQSGI